MAETAPRIGRRWPLRQVLIVPFLLQLFAFVGLNAWLSIRNTQQSVEKVAAALRGEVTLHIWEYINNRLETPRLINELNADAIAQGQLDIDDPEALGRHFYLQLQRFEAVSFIFMGTANGGAAGAGRGDDGRIVVDTTDLDPSLGLVAGTRREYRADAGGGRLELLQETPGFDARQRPWYRAALESGGPVWSEVYPFFVDDSLAVAANLPVFGEGGELELVLGAEFTLQRVDEFLRGLEVGQTGQTFLLERNGNLVASSVPEQSVAWDEAAGRFVQRRAVDSGDPLLAGTARFLEERYGSFGAIEAPAQLEFDLGGRHFVHVTPTSFGPGIDWLIAVVLPEADFAEGVRQRTRNILWLCLAATLLATGLGWLTARWISRPIRRVSAAARAITDGELDQRLEGHGVAELHDLAGSLNRMAEQLRDSFGELEDRVRQRTAELQEAKEAADSASRTKSQFLANISHEIRTPLAAVLGYVELLFDSRRSSAETAEYLQTIRSNGHHLNQLLGDLLDLSKIEAGRLELDIKRCELGRLLSRLRSAFEPRAAEKGLRLEIDADTWLPWSFAADPVRIQQVLSNLLANAVKFTDEGSITLSLQCDQRPLPGASEGPSEATLAFLVEDTGSGISREDQQRLFQRFTQLDSSAVADPRAGFGLGLSICRQMTEMMGGTIEVISRLGEGSRFTVRIPVAQCEQWARGGTKYQRTRPLPPLAELTPLRGRVLIADDSKSLQTLCTRILSRWGLDCAIADDGEEAVAKALGESFDLILMDWQMPRVDGLEATRRLRRAGLDLPILAFTAAAMSGDKEECLAAGCTGYLVKPIDFQELHRQLRALLRPAAGRRAAASSADEAVDAELAELSRRYARSLPPRVETLSDALGKGDWKTFGAAIHKLAGTAGSYGFREISEVAAELETLARRRDAAAARMALEELARRVRERARTSTRSTDRRPPGGAGTAPGQEDAT